MQTNTLSETNTDYENLYATITLHHLIITLDDVIGGKMQPHLFCKPIAKHYKDKEALCELAFGGYEKVMFGSDSAPHPKHEKECCGCAAGVFSASVALCVLADLFSKNSNEVNLQKFISDNACKVHNLTFEKEKIIVHVIKNKDIRPITTPYFEFFELDAMCQIGEFDYMTDMLHSYWGGMIRLGATTIWEEYFPDRSGTEHYAMYGRLYGKSLCHAWGASPIYLLGKYALGVRPTSPAYATYEVKPSLMCFGSFSGKVPVPNGTVEVSVDASAVTVKSDVEGGTLVIKDKTYPIEAGKPLTVPYEK